MIVAGFGFRRAATADALRAALTAAQNGAPPITHLATAADKVAALSPLAAALGLPVVSVGAEALASAPTLTISPAAQKARGTGSMAEAAALAAIGPGARLLCPRQISPDRMAACAIAQTNPCQGTPS